MTKEEMQKQILDAVSSGALKAANIVEKKIIVEEGGVGIQNNYYGNNGSKEAVEENIKDESVDEKEIEQREYCELTDGTMEQHLQFFKEAMLKAQDIVYKSELTKLVSNTYDWVAAERLGKDIGLLKNYDELADILKDDNFREVPKNSQNLTPYRTIIAENTKYPNWQCYKPNEDGKFRKFKQFADAIYSLYKLNCEKNHIKPFGNM